MADIRTVAMRDGLMMVGNHHLLPGQRHWRSDAAAFAIVDYHGTPLLWKDGDQIVGEMSLTVAKPEFDRGRPKIVTPLENETLLWFEVVRVKGIPMIRTWWARGKNVDQTQRVARLEALDIKAWPERMKQLLQLMNWVN